MNAIVEPAQGSVLSGAAGECALSWAPPLSLPLLSVNADVGGWRHDSGLDSWPNSTFHAADGWAHNCVFDISTTLSASPDGSSPDATWVTAGDEYGSCHGSPSWCGLHSWVGVSRDGGRTFIDTAWDSLYAVDQVRGRVCAQSWVLWL